MLHKIKLIIVLLFLANSAFAQNISSNTSASVTGGSCSSNLFATSISTAGVPTCTQPALANLSDASSVTTLTGSQVLTNKTLTSPVLNTPVLKLPSTAIGSLPTCNAGAAGTIYLVTDALLPAALATVAAGGAVVVTVFCNGTNWIVS